MVGVRIIVGANFDGELALEKSGGTTIIKEEYDTAPFAGITFNILF